TFRDKDSAKRSVRALPVAGYVTSEWEEWLQTQRVELNAMTSPEFIEWLDSKFEAYADKVVPPTPVLRAQFEKDVRSSVEQMLAEEILTKAGFREQVNALVTKAAAESASMDLESLVRTGLAKVPEDKWSKPLANKAVSVAQNVLNP
ncbi:hypothetical protein LC612_39950, partial [Nostoc sp. CHAB 5834]|nr:hypothetical protein [Nostoc sp. CHAB 5834]